MELNITGGIFMVLVVAIVTAVIMCCCKAYAFCRKKVLLEEGEETTTVFRAPEPPINRHLPIPKKYNDKPPKYDDILSGQVATLPVISETADDNSATKKDSKSNDEIILVNWSYDNCIIDEVNPPLYSCVVIEESNDTTDDAKISPPSYYAQTLPKRNDIAKLNEIQTSRKSLNEPKRVYSTLQSVSALIAGGSKKADSTQDDPDLEIGCPTDVITPTTSSSSISQASALTQSSQKS